MPLAAILMASMAPTSWKFLPLLADALRKEGFTEDEVEGIYYRNAMRFFEENL